MRLAVFGRSAVVTFSEKQENTVSEAPYWQSKWYIDEDPSLATTECVSRCARLLLDVEVLDRSGGADDPLADHQFLRPVESVPRQLLGR